MKKLLSAVVLGLFVTSAAFAQSGSVPPQAPRSQQEAPRSLAGSPEKDKKADKKDVKKKAEPKKDEVKK